jgi:hypothetical protein
MKAPIELPLVVVLGVLTTTAFAGIWFGIARGAEAGITDSAPPGACGAAIGQLESALNLSETRAHGHVVASAPESVGAMLHHQPTRDSVAKAEIESVKRIETSLATARDLRSEGKRSECISILARIALPVGFR